MQSSSPAPLYLMGLGMPLGGPEGASPVLLPPGVEVLIGGRAQLAAFAAHPAEKIAVGADMEQLFRAVAANRRAGRVQAALCSGDPLFFGLGARLLERFGPEGARVLPGVSSLQAACAVLGLPWEKARPVSLHGRGTLLPLAHALTAGGPVFVLADAAATPGALADFMDGRGFGRYRLHVLENLFMDAASGLPCAEFRAEAGVAEARRGMRGEAPSFADSGVAAPRRPVRRVMLLVPPDGEGDTPGGNGGGEGACFGIPDALFAREKNVFTKAPVRAAALASLRIAPEHMVWDLGAGSGAVAVEACRLAHRGMVAAVEEKAARVACILENRRRFGAANLAVVRASLPGCLRPPGAARHGLHDEEGCFGAGPLPLPHRIFLGGGLGGAGGGPECAENGAQRGPGGAEPEQSGRGGTAREILQRCWDLLLPGGRMTASCALLSSLELARSALADLGGQVEVVCVQASASASLGGDVRLEGMNPVFLVTADKPR